MSNPFASTAAEDPTEIPSEALAESRRGDMDRRLRHPLLSDWRYAFRGRRRGFRRNYDYVSARTVLDWYRPSLLFFVVSTYVLSGVDAFLTLTLLGLGVVVETNPFMEMLMERDVALFVGVKTLVTGVGLVGLALYSKVRLFTHLQTELVIYALFTIYTALVGYEIYLMRLVENGG